MEVTLQSLKYNWKDEPEYHKHIHESFSELVNNDEPLKFHRDYIENNVWGFGERSFWWLWKLILDEIKCDNKDHPYLLEIGVFRGATISLWRMLLQNSIVFGVTPLSNAGGVWESDYKSDIKKIHHDFNLHHPEILKGFSNGHEIIAEAILASPYSVIYIDGGHSREDIDNDLTHYAPLVKQSGYLVIDDACNDMNMPFGYFQGIADVTDGVVEYMRENGYKWEFITNVVHLRVYKRI